MDLTVDDIRAMAGYAGLFMVMIGGSVAAVSPNKMPGLLLMIGGSIQVLTFAKWH